ncbi:MAG: hypothetical protein RLZZ461_402 [Planctomycetota bacterium]
MVTSPEPSRKPRDQGAISQEKAANCRVLAGISGLATPKAVAQVPAGTGGSIETTGPIDRNFSNRRRTSVSD